jgi:hypothetical protein
MMPSNYLYRLGFYREAIAVFCAAGRGAKRSTELNAEAFNSRLRLSASVCG